MDIQLVPNTQGQALTEEYNGTAWAESGDLDNRAYTSGFGTQTAGLAFAGGYNSSLLET